MPHPPTDVPPPPARPRGRPRDPARLERVLAAAGQLFQTRGLDQTSMDDVATQAGVSKMTVYSYFADKEALFAAAIARGAERALAGEAPVLDPRQPQAMLTALGQGLMGLLRHPHVARMTATLFALGEAHPQVREAYFHNGPQRMHAVVRDYLLACQAAGSLQVPDADLAARHFCALCVDIDQWRVWLNLPRPSTNDEAHALASAVGLFMRAHRPDGAPA